MSHQTHSPWLLSAEHTSNGLLLYLLVLLLPVPALRRQSKRIAVYCPVLRLGEPAIAVDSCSDWHRWAVDERRRAIGERACQFRTVRITIACSFTPNSSPGGRLPATTAAPPGAHLLTPQRVILYTFCSTPSRFSRSRFRAPTAAPPDAHLALSGHMHHSARAHFSTSRCPPLAAAEHVSMYMGQPGELQMVLHVAPVQDMYVL